MELGGGIYGREGNNREVYTVKIKRKAYISLEVVFLLTIMVISGMYVTIKLFNKGHNVSGQEAEAFSKVNHTVNNAINVGSSGGGGSGGGGGGSTPSEPTGVIDTIYWGIDSTGKLIISDVQVATALEGKSGSFAGTDTFDFDSAPPWTSHSGDITSIKVERLNRRVAPASTAMWFARLDNVTNIDVSNLDTSNVTNMFGTFGSCGFGATTLSIEGLETWNTSNVTNMAFMFINCMAKELDLSNWDVAKVETFERMFYFSIGLRTIKTPKNIPSTVNITDITSSDLWDISDNNTVYTAGTFPVGNGNTSHTLSLIGPDGLSETIYWGIVENTLIIRGNPVSGALEGKSGSFSRSSEFRQDNVPWTGYKNIITSAIVQNVNPLSTAYWFNSLRNITYVNVSGLDTSYVTNMRGMFLRCGEDASTFEIIGMEQWDTSNVTDMSDMFSYSGRSATTWTIGDISAWNTSKVYNMSEMFSHAASNTDSVYLDFTRWSTDSLEYAGCMFSNFGSSAENKNILGLEKLEPFGIYSCVA